MNGVPCDDHWAVALPLQKNFGKDPTKCAITLVRVLGRKLRVILLDRLFSFLELKNFRRFPLFSRENILFSFRRTEFPVSLVTVYFKSIKMNHFHGILRYICNTVKLFVLCFIRNQDDIIYNIIPQWFF